MVNIALVQSHIEWEDKDINISKAKKVIEELKDKALDLILFPEMSFTGFSMNIKNTAEDGETVEKIIEIAIENKVAIGFGWVKRKADKAENHYTIVDSDGSILNDYVKMHSFTYGGEDKEFLSGNEISTFVIKDMKCSSFICYDLRFPELFRKNNEFQNIFIIPANWPESRREHWCTLLKARAIENQAYVLGVNCVGEMGNLNYSGDSCIVTPDGAMLGIITNTEGVLIASVKEDDFKIRESFPVLKDKKYN